MSFWNYITKGVSVFSSKKKGHKFYNYIGHCLAKRGGNVTIGSNCFISPEAKINARDGEIIIGDNCSIAPGAIVQGNVTLGDYCTIQSYSILVGYGSKENKTGHIKIGDKARIAPHCMLIAGNHKFQDTERTIHGQGVKAKSIIIQEDVWVGGRVNIMAGITIGTSSVPAKLIKKRKMYN